MRRAKRIGVLERLGSRMVPNFGICDHKPPRDRARRSHSRNDLRPEALLACIDIRDALNFRPQCIPPHRGFPLPAGGAAPALYS
jgi:hypothetical protein